MYRTGIGGMVQMKVRQQITRDNKGEEEAKWQAKRRGRQGDER